MSNRWNYYHPSNYSPIRNSISTRPKKKLPGDVNPPES